VRRERWTLNRGIAVLSALIAFYVTYLAYRNLKSVVPLLRPGELFDRQLAEFDRSLLGGSDPAALMHDILGTGVSTHVLSWVYMFFFLFIPGTLALALVFSKNLQAGLFYATAQSLNWVLGAASYFLLPSVGPIYFDPATFASLPVSEVSRLQDVLLDQRIEFLADPAAGGAQSIAAFGSLHVSILFTGAVAAHLLGVGRNLRMVVWVLTGLTAAATIYFGWHYLLDDVGGIVIALLALALSRALTGFDLGLARRFSTPDPSPA
jgi:membrane-associated phospholipid phosphatase